ncbi:MAG: hypothetical protein ACREVV_02875 [Steroidobacteraceae bacterium]
MKRVPQGRKQSEQGEQIFFDDPAVDELMGVLMALATDHYVLRDRVRVLEQQLAQSGYIDAAALATAPATSDAAAAQEDAAAFVGELLRPLLGLQETAGTGGRFSLKANRRRTRS